MNIRARVRKKVKSVATYYKTKNEMFHLLIIWWVWQGRGSIERSLK